MEDTHGATNWLTEEQSLARLNPYYNGRYSWRKACCRKQRWPSCLNPYYNGRYSWRKTETQVLKDKTLVLILIIMEDTHGESRHISP